MFNKLSTLDNIESSYCYGPETISEVSSSSNDVGLFNEVTTNTALIIIPYWIADAVRRNKLDHIDILEYSRVQKIMSTEDMAQFLRINSRVIPGIDDAQYAIRHAWDQSKSDSLDYHTFYTQLNRVEAIVNVEQDINARLYKDNFDIETLEESDSLYHIDIKKDSNIYIVIKAGFMNAMNSNEFTKRFYSDVLKKLYSLMPIHTVSNYEIFKHYLKLLK